MPAIILMHLFKYITLRVSRNINWTLVRFDVNVHALDCDRYVPL